VTHPYMPNSAPATRDAMMQALGITDIDVLFEQIPADHLLTKPIELEAGVRSEYRLQRRMTDLLRRNVSAADVRNFLGAGCWQHYVPAVCDEIAARSEFVTPV